MNAASDEAHVDAQIGYVHGNVTIYSVAESDPPHRKYQVGLNYLNGDMPRRAEALIRDAAMSGHRSNEVAYYWVLATLSDRSFDHLGPDEFTHLSTAGAMVTEFPQDSWRQAFDVVIELIYCITEEAERGAPDFARFSAAFDAYRALHKERREEIHRHLDMIMNGWIQDQVEALEAQRVQAMRLSGNRVHRVWKFFEPIPTAPRKTVHPEPTLDPDKQIKVAIGAVLGGLGIIWTTHLMAASSPPALVVALALVGAWLAATIKVGLPQRRTDKYQPPHTPWYEAVSSSVDYWFDQSGPIDPIAARQWQWASGPVRAKLKADLVSLYGMDHHRVGPIRWLIKWHASNAAQQFSPGVPLNPSGPPTAVLAGNTALVIAGLIAFFVTAAASPLGMLGAGTLLGLGAMMAWSDIFDYLAAVQGHSRQTAQSNRRFAAEQQEYERWCSVLADRPTDAEMAAWLDYDKMMIKSVALKHYGLSNRDVIAHLTLTEAAQHGRRARVLFGPLRYSAYVVLLFLLTEGGVRQVTVNLDFANGKIDNERRTTFRYEMIASARVAEVAVLSKHGHRRIVAREEIPPNERQPPPLSRAFRLSLVNAQHIDVLVDNYETGPFDHLRENVTFLTALALDTSGVTGALRILEAVSAEGREWLAHEQARRRRRLRDFKESQKIPGFVEFLRSPKVVLPGTRDKGSAEG